MIPKYRAWNSAEKHMYENVGIDPYAEDYLVFGKEWAIIDMYGSMPALMQWTGMKDKNGKEIYESDIVRLYYSDGSFYDRPVEIKYGLHYVGFDSDAAATGPALGFYFSPYPYDYPEYHTNRTHLGIGMYNWEDTLEVLGNRYETPELLQSEEEG